MRNARVHNKAGQILLMAVLSLGLFAGCFCIFVLSGSGSLKPSGGEAARARKDFWFFFSPGSGDLSGEIVHLRAFLRKNPRFRFRPCLIIEDFEKVRRPTKEFARTVKVLSHERIGQSTVPFSLSVWDRDGMRLAKRIGIQRLPAYALLRTDRRSGVIKAHVAYGLGANLEELARCK